MGYSGRGAPKEHPEYLMAKSENRLILNLVDVENPAYIAKEIMDEALHFIDQSLESGRKVLVHCNQGMSRSPDQMISILGPADAIHRTTIEIPVRGWCSD